MVYEYGATRLRDIGGTTFVWSAGPQGTGWYAPARGAFLTEEQAELLGRRLRRRRWAVGVGGAPRPAGV